MTRKTIYQHPAADRSFKDLRLVWEEGTDRVILYYDTRRHNSFGTVLGFDEVAEFFQRMQRAIGYPWTTPGAAQALEAVTRLQESIRATEAA